MTSAVLDNPSSERSTQPLVIRLSAAKQALEIEWQGGGSTTLSCAALRQACRCAECVAKRRRGETLSIPPDVSLCEIVPFGPSAVRLIFSDGHSRGIFPFPYFRELSAEQAAIPVS